MEIEKKYDIAVEIPILNVERRLGGVDANFLNTLLAELTNTAKVLDDFLGKIKFDKTPKKKYMKLKNIDKKILALAAKMPQLVTEDVVVELGTSPQTANRHLRLLADDGRLKRYRRSSKGYIYILLSKPISTLPAIDVVDRKVPKLHTDNGREKLELIREG